MVGKTEYSLNDSRFISTCWSILILHFILSGILRGLIFPKIANYLYFLPLPILIIIFFGALRIDSKVSYFHFCCISLSIFLALYQIFLVANKSIDLKTATYGWFLYGLPLVGMDAAAKTLNKEMILRITLLFELCLIPNLILAVLQAVNGDSRFYSAGFGEGLQSAYGVQRATGTFSSAAGYALFLSLTTSLLLTRNILFEVSRVRNFLSFGVLAIQIPISGSRTAIFSVFIVLLSTLFFSRRDSFEILRIRSTKLVISILLIVMSTAFLVFANSATFKATSTRFLTANQADSPSSRLISQIRFSTEGIQFLYGSGLGSRANATTALGVNWVEFDAQRVLIESGVLIGLVLLGFRILLAVRFIKDSLNANLSGCLPITATVIPILFFGQFMGQGSIAAGTWIGIYILEKLRLEKVSQNIHSGYSS
jgi:hypothetical protein